MKFVVAFGIVAITMISFVAFLFLINDFRAQGNGSNYINPSSTSVPSNVTPTPSSAGASSTNGSSTATPGSAESTRNGGTNSSSGSTSSGGGSSVNSTYWEIVAANAWGYFQPNVGVDSSTGLPYAGGTNFKAFTDWDLAAYIQAIIAAQEMGLINSSGAWGSDARIDKILTFLESRPLNATTNWPFWFYDATNGQGYLTTTVYQSDSVNLADTGKLLIALNNLIAFDPSLTTRIDNLVYNVYGNRSNYASLVPIIEDTKTSSSIYNYYLDSGFACFWPTQLSAVPNQILANIINYNTITVYGVKLPDDAITCEPLLFSIFEFKNPSADLLYLMKQVYLAEEAYYNATGQYVAYSEGASMSSVYVYEWVIGPNGVPWQITDTSLAYITINPTVFTKVAYGFLALYDTTYARNLVNYIDQTLPSPTNGYYEGVDTQENPDTSISSETNSLILEASVYCVLG